MLEKNSNYEKELRKLQFENLFPDKMEHESKVIIEKIDDVKTQCLPNGLTEYIAIDVNGKELFRYCD